jgi:hypothetical protein
MAAGDLYVGLCVHFTGLLSRTCRRGIGYQLVADRAGRYPCISWDEATTRCQHCHYPTPAEAKALAEGRRPANPAVGKITRLEDLF